jgi:hypothetical protein
MSSVILLVDQGTPSVPFKAWQIKSSLNLRISCFVLGFLAFLVGAIVLGKVTGLTPFGITCAVVCLIAGPVGSLLFLCISSVKKAKKEKEKIIDPRAKEKHTLIEYQKDPATNNRIKCKFFYTSLTKFLFSQNEEDVALMRSIMQEAEIHAEDEFEPRLLENFGTNDIDLALTIKYKNGKRDNPYIKELLLLIFWPSSKLLALNIEKVHTFDNDQKNLLSLRLEHLKPPISCYQNDTLGCYLSSTSPQEIFQEPQALYAYLNYKQVIIFLTTMKACDETLIKALFPYGPQYPFLSQRSLNLLLKLPKEEVERLLPHLYSQLLWEFIKKTKVVFDFSKLKENQLREIFSTDASDKKKSIQRMEELSIEILNQLLVLFVVDQLVLIPPKHLKNSRLNLKILSPEKIRGMFSMTLESRERMSLLPTQNFRYVRNIVYSSTEK